MARTTGVRQPSRIVTSADQTRAAVLDPLANEIALVDVEARRAFVVPTGETPIAALFAGHDLIVAARDAGRIERIEPDGRATSLDSGVDPELLAEAKGRIYVYSRLDGMLEEIDGATFTKRRRLQLLPFASDLATDGESLYLIDPREAKLVVVSCSTMQRSGESDVGVVPLSIALDRSGNALRASRLAIADPAARRVWTLEGSETFRQAVARGFVRGLVGLRLGGAHSSAFPTGIDRVIAAGSSTLAYDSSRGVLYDYSSGRAMRLAEGVRPDGFAVVGKKVAIWQQGTLRWIPLR